MGHVMINKYFRVGRVCVSLCVCVCYTYTKTNTQEGFKYNTCIHQSSLSPLHCYSLTLLYAPARAATYPGLSAQRRERGRLHVYTHTHTFTQSSRLMQFNSNNPPLLEMLQHFPTLSPHFSSRSVPPDPSLLFLMGPGRPLEPGQAPSTGTNPVGTDLWILAA